MPTSLRPVKRNLATPQDCASAWMAIVDNASSTYSKTSTPMGGAYSMYRVSCCDPGTIADIPK